MAQGLGARWDKGVVCHTKLVYKTIRTLVSVLLGLLWGLLDVSSAPYNLYRARMARALGAYGTRGHSMPCQAGL